MYPLFATLDTSPWNTSHQGINQTKKATFGTLKSLIFGASFPPKSISYYLKKNAIKTNGQGTPCLITITLNNQSTIFQPPILSWPRLHEHLIPYKWEGNISVEVNIVQLTCTIPYSSSFVNVPAKHVSNLTTMTMKRSQPVDSLIVYRFGVSLVGKHQVIMLFKLNTVCFFFK